MRQDDVKIAVFSGGAGSRLWPVSRRATPKQFQPLTGHDSLFQQLARVLDDGFGIENVFVFTGRDYVDAVATQVPALPRSNIVAEPEMRDTLAAVGYAAAVIAHRFPKSTLITLWGGDHLIRRPDTFVRGLRAACEIAVQDGRSVMVDVTPTAPSTQLGYVEVGVEHMQRDGFTAYEFVRFTEKPDLETARAYIEGGRHLWNTGYFVWTTPGLLDLYQAYAPEAYDRLATMMAAMGTADEERVVADQYARIPKQSVDYGVFAHIQAGEMLAIAADLGWADVGAWDVLRDELRDASHKNVILADHYVEVATRDTLLYSSTGKLIATVGLDGIIVVDTPDALLVAAADQAQDVKKIVERLRDEGKTDYL